MMVRWKSNADYGLAKAKKCFALFVRTMKKDHEKLLDIESKVAKTYRQQSTPRRFDCGETSHYRANCPNKKSIDKDKDTRAKKN